MVLILPPLAILLYLAGALQLARGIGGGRMPMPATFWVIPALALLAHLGTHALIWRAVGGADLHFASALSLVGAGMVALTLPLAARGRMAALATIVLPIAAATLALYAAIGKHTPANLDWRLQLHAWSALLAYAALALAALLAVLLWMQERALRQRRMSGWLRALPPLVELETLMFRTIAFGFALLTLALLSGVLFVEDLLAQHLAHKTVFSALSWLAFGALLLGRWLRGWRGRIAVRWTLTAMSLLVLAFFGSKFVLEFLLQRG